jgi:hypothetical protein
VRLIYEIDDIDNHSFHTPALRACLRRNLMHPWMAFWIWSGAMSRICRDTLVGVESDPDAMLRSAGRQPMAPALICVGNYLETDLVKRPVPGQLLDRLADLYWTERDSELAI